MYVVIGVSPNKQRKEEKKNINKQYTKMYDEKKRIYCTHLPGNVYSPCGGLMHINLPE